MFTLSQKQLLFLSIISLVFFFTFFVLINPLITNAYTITEELSIIGDLNISGTEVTLGSETFNQGKYMSFNLNQGGSKIYDDVHMHIVTDDYLFLESRERVFVTTDLEVWGSLIADLFQGEFEGNLTGDVEGTVTGSLIGNATGLSGNPSLTVNNLTTLGIVTLPNNSITDAMIPNSITASKYFPVIGGTINGNVKLNDHNITNIRTLSTTNLTVFGTIKFPNNSLTDNMIPNTITASNYLPLSGGTMSGDINLGTNDLTNGGSITATSFSGNLTGNVTGWRQELLVDMF
ncbi:MAG: Cell wall surface anchor family protein [candidate division CPR3 bacterium GW2011_GWF2_35_18]|uniref:Cell wall surface anchor family protein n=1 Tax=candidate division CPR3 bacterium GW2011_GWF2_35_18 TaxID=1618350 RepID=A0A0G0BZN8_UNCC3|nr:MAG: Cell wall surface anchor family protein [candidate division CPR3 bacterium GW2011_GWF2_35_18]